MSEIKYGTITSLDALNKLVRFCVDNKKEVCIDLETEGLNSLKDKIVGVGLAIRPSESFYIPINHKFDQPFSGEEALNILRELVEKNILIVYNAAFDIEFLINQAKAKVDLKNVKDVMLMAYTIAKYKGLSLAAVGKQEGLPVEDWKFADFMASQGLTRKNSLGEVPIQKVSEYCGRDVVVTLMLYEKFKTVESWGIYKLEKAVLPVSMKIKQNGILIDKEFFNREKENIGGELKTLEEMIQKQVSELAKEDIEFNVGSSHQLGHILYDVLKLPCDKMTPKGKRSTDESQLLALAERHYLVKNILAFRGMKKCLSSYLETMNEYCADDGRIHSNFRQTGTIHGRFSSDDPNLQQIPNENKWFVYLGEKEKREIKVAVRKGFIVPEDFWFMEYDYSQIEARLAAGITQEPVLLKSFAEGVDFHTKTTSLMFGVPMGAVTEYQRRIGKICNFALIYGGSGKTLYEALKEDVPDITLPKAREYYRRYVSSYPTMFEQAEVIRDNAERMGYAETIFGRRIPIFDFQSQDTKVREHGRRLAYNATVSGSAADILKQAMYKFYKKHQEMGWGDSVKLILTVHDSLAFEVSKKLDLREFVRQMESILLFKKDKFPDITASMSLGECWGELKKQEKTESSSSFLDRILGQKEEEKKEEKIFKLILPEGAERTEEQVNKFKEFLIKNPGVNTVELWIGNSFKVLPWKTSVDLKYRDKISLMMGGIFVEKLSAESLSGVFE